MKIKKCDECKLIDTWGLEMRSNDTKVYVCWDCLAESDLNVAMESFRTQYGLHYNEARLIADEMDDLEDN